MGDEPVARQRERHVDRVGAYVNAGGRDASADQFEQGIRCPQRRRERVADPARPPQVTELISVSRSGSPAALMSADLMAVGHASGGVLAQHASDGRERRGRAARSGIRVTMGGDAHQAGMGGVEQPAHPSYVRWGSARAGARSGTPGAVPASARA